MNRPRGSPARSAVSVPVQENGGEIQQRESNQDGQDVDETQAPILVLIRKAGTRPFHRLLAISSYWRRAAVMVVCEINQMGPGSLFRLHARARHPPARWSPRSCRRPRGPVSLDRTRPAHR